MIKNYLMIAFRNLMRQKLYSLINVFGLALGIACCVLIGMYVHFHLSFDRFHEKKDRIFQVNRGATTEKGVWRTAITSAAEATHMKAEWPEIEQTVRVWIYGSRLLKWGDKQLRSSDFFYVDAAFLEVFSFPMVEGDPKTALEAPFSIVLTRSMAKRVFGDENPIGKTLRYDNKYDFTVTGVVENVPHNSHIQFNYLASFESLKDILNRPDLMTDKVNVDYYTYVLLNKGVDPKVLVEKFPALYQKYWDQESMSQLVLEPIVNLHLDTETEYSFGLKANRRYVYTFGSVAVLILLIACVNFMNLATARSARRAKEVGLRKVLGAHRVQLIRQFLGEAILLSLLAVCLSLALAELMLPFFKELSGMPLSFDNYHAWYLVLVLLFGGLLVGIVSGSYPAFFLSAFSPIAVLKGALGIGNRSSLFRYVLIIFQFSVTTGLIAGTLIVLKQFDFMRSHPLGFDREHVLHFGSNRDLVAHKEAFKQALLQNPNILQVSLLNSVPGLGRPNQGFHGEGDLNRSMFSLIGDSDLLGVLGIQLVAGRNFSPEMASDAQEAYILNETAVRELGWDQPIGRKFKVWDRDWGTVIGVVKDFNFQSLHNKIQPLVIYQRPEWCWQFAVKIRGSHIDETLAYIRAQWESITQTYPFYPQFLDTTFDYLYRNDLRLSKIVGSFCGLAIFVACLGLFGLTAFATERRTKEIGIRKVMGASVIDIVRLISKEFVLLVLLANVIAWPVSYYVMHNWLQDFYYRIDLTVGVFALSGVLTMVIAMLTVSQRAIRAAWANPVDALRYE